MRIQLSSIKPNDQKIYKMSNNATLLTKYFSFWKTATFHQKHVIYVKNNWFIIFKWIHKYL